jgi:FtsP/CotA-like multicopper oxidase with cupredoxin domain
MSRNQRLTFLGIAALIAVVAIVILVTGGNDPEETSQQAGTTPTATATRSATEASDESTPEPTPTPKPPLLQSGNVEKLRFEEGDTVRFRVRNDAPEEIHVHGYDIVREIEPGKTATVSFKATITGIFEIEFHGSAEQIGELRVDPK